MKRQGYKSFRNPEDRLKDLKEKLVKAERCLVKNNKTIAKKKKQMEQDGHTYSYRLEEMEYERNATLRDINELRENICNFQKRFRGGRKQ